MNFFLVLPLVRLLYQVVESCLLLALRLRPAVSEVLPVVAETLITGCNPFSDSNIAVAELCYLDSQYLILEAITANGSGWSQPVFLSPMGCNICCVKLIRVVRSMTLASSGNACGQGPTEDPKGTRMYVILNAMLIPASLIKC